VLSRARTRGVPRYFQPTSATQSCSLSTSLHPCSRRSNEHPTRAGLFRETRRFTPTSLLGRDRSILGKVFACRCRDDLRRLTPPSAIPLRALRPLNRTCAGLNHFDHFHERAVTLRSLRWPRDAFYRSRFERLLPYGRSRPCPLRAKPTRLESRSRRRYASLVTEGPLSPLQARAQGYCARGVPTKLAPAYAPRATANGDVFRVTLLWGPRDPNIQLLPYVVTHGHTRRSSRSSSARGYRLCPRCLPTAWLAPRHRPTLERHDRPSEEPCLLQLCLRPISRPSLSRSSPRERQAV
jgi:hypothetical protein